MNKQLFAAIALFGLVFSSCKKGEEDPFISFRSRDARIMGKWKLSKYESTTISQFPEYSSTIKAELSGNVLTTRISSSNVDTIAISLSKLTLDMNLLEGGKLDFTEVKELNLTQGSYNWYWANNSSNKTGLYLGGPASCTIRSNGDFYSVLRLASDELILTDESADVNEVTDGSSATTSSKTSRKLTFTKAD